MTLADLRVSIARAILGGFRLAVLPTFVDPRLVSIARAILGGFRPGQRHQCHNPPAVSIARAILGGFRPVYGEYADKTLGSFNRKGDSWGVQAGEMVAAKLEEWVSIARAILGGFRRVCLIVYPCLRAVSIARAILGGFRPRRVLRFSLNRSVSIARAILGGFRPCEGLQTVNFAKFQSQGRFLGGSGLCGDARWHRVD